MQHRPGYTSVLSAFIAPLACFIWVCGCDDKEHTLRVEAMSTANRLFVSVLHEVSTGNGETIDKILDRIDYTRLNVRVIRDADSITLIYNEGSAEVYIGRDIDLWRQQKPNAVAVELDVPELRKSVQIEYDGTKRWVEGPTNEGREAD